MEYVIHKYSKRVYKVMKDHGPDHPYLSCFPFIREVGPRTLDRFFTPHPGPESQVSHPITVPQEMEWEGRWYRMREPLVVKAPVVRVHLKRRKRKF